MSDIQKLIDCGKALGLIGPDLQEFIKEQQKISQTKLDFGAKEEEKRRQHETAEAEKIRQAEEKRYQDQGDREERRLVREQKVKEREAELEEKKLQKADKDRTLQQEELQLKLNQLKADQDFRNLELAQRAQLEEQANQTKLQMKELELQATQSFALNASEFQNTTFSGNTSGRKHQKLDSFDPKKDDLDAYLIRFEAYAENCGWPNNTWAMNLGLSIKGRALEVYSALSPEDRQDYTKVKASLMMAFNLTEEGFRKKFLACKPTNSDTWQTYHSRIQNIFTRWIEMTGIEKNYSELFDLLLREQIVSVFKEDLRIFIRERAPKSAQEVIRIAESFREARGCSAVDLCGFDSPKSRDPSKGSFYKKPRDFSDQSKFSRFRPNPNSNPKDTTGSTDTAAAGLFNPTKGSEDKKSKPNGNGPFKKKIINPAINPKIGGKPPDKRIIRCFNCNSRDHLLKDCPRDLPKARAAIEQDSDEDAEECDYSETSESEEFGASCIPTLEAETSSSSIQLGTDVLYTTESCAALSPLVEYRATVNGIPCQAIRDTGLTSIVVHSKLVRKDQYTGNIIRCRLMDNSIVKAREAMVDIDCIFYKGPAKVMVMNNPINDLAIGNVANSKDFDQENLVEATSAFAFTYDTTKGDQTKFESLSPTTTPLPQEASTVPTLCEESNPGEFKDQTEQAQAVSTRAQAEKEKKSMKPLKVLAEITDVSPSKFKSEQENDPTLLQWWKYAKDGKKFYSKSGEVFWKIEDGLLYRVFTEPTQLQRTFVQLAVPFSRRISTLKLAHDTLFGGHLGTRKTGERLKAQFYWPGIDRSVRLYLRSCEKCQKFEPKGRTPRATLGSMPLIDQPFRRIAVDLVGPLKPITDRGHQYILTVVDYATRYPEAIPLKKIDTENVAEALLELYTRVGLPEEVLSDLGTQFISETMNEVSRLLSIRRLTTTPYHPMANGLVEKFNGTMKNMLKKLCQEKPKDWDRYLQPLMFAYRETPHLSTGFSPFEMLYGWPVRGLMEAVKELWSDQTATPETRSTYTYVIDLRSRLADTCKFTMENLKEAQKKYKDHYDKKTKRRNFEVGQYVLLLLPTDNRKLLMTWKGPYKITQKVGELDYKIDIQGRHQTFHVNMMKRYIIRTPEVIAQITNKPLVPNPDTAASMVIVTSDILAATCIGVIEDPRDAIPTPISPKETLKDIDISFDLEDSQHRELWLLLSQFQSLFSDIPSRTPLLSHDIKLKSDIPFRKKQYPIPFSLIPNVKKEVQNMLDMDVIEPSDSPYSSPYLMIKKPDNSIRFCVDLRMLNSMTEFDAEPMPDVELLFTKFKGCQYFTELDMTKGYWQLPVAEYAKKYTAFATPMGHYQFKVMPFGCQGGPSSFSRLMRRALGEIEGCQNFLDNILISTRTWQEHLAVLKVVLERLQKANLKLRPSKCHVSFHEIQCLGYMVDGNNVWPITSKVEPLLEAQKPRTKKLLKSFLGYSGFYQRFIPFYASMAGRLSDKLKKNRPSKLLWDAEDVKCFEKILKALASHPILILPDFSKTFYLGTDASGSAIGSVLMQEDDGLRKPVAYASRKLIDAETRYSTIERECLAIVWAITKFSRYLYGRKFVVLTDHKPLQFLKSSKHVNSRLMRWSLALQPFNFEIQAIKGSENCGPDFLSRIYEDDEQT